MQSQRIPVKGLIFDMDGVLVDSEPLHLMAYQELLGEYGIAYTAEDNRELLGRREVDCIDILINRYKLTATHEALLQAKEAIVLRLLKSSSKEMPGVRAVLETAKLLKLPIAVASSANLATIALVVDTLDIRKYFNCLTSGEEVANGKPAPDVFLLAAERLGVPPANCLVIEDSLNGVLAAKAAGMNCIAVPCEATKHQDHSKADLKISSLAELNLNDWCAHGG